MIKMTNNQQSNKSVKGSSNAIYMLDLRLKERPSKMVKVRRFLIGMCVTIFLLSLVVFGIIKLMGGNASIEQDVQWIQVSVEQGQTIWSLVRDNQPTNSKVDIRELVNIATHRHQDTVMLRAGETIEIPVYKGVK
jgi:hypothetical protein